MSHFPTVKSVQHSNGAQCEVSHTSQYDWYYEPETIASLKRGRLHVHFPDELRVWEAYGRGFSCGAAFLLGLWTSDISKEERTLM